MTEMDVSTEIVPEIWMSKVFGVPSIPESRREHYPFSKGKAVVNRLKLAAVLLNVAVALWRMEEPCLRLSLFLNCWLFFITCEGVYKNYPWREPFNIWLWKLYWTIPFPRVFFCICSALLLFVISNLLKECELYHPLSAGIVVWSSCMMCWPLVRESWHKRVRTEDDYEQFSSARSPVLMVPGPCRVLCAVILSPSLLCYLVAFAMTWMASLSLSGWFLNVWTAITRILLAGCLAVLCCHGLPEDVARTLTSWEAEEANYARRIENCLRIVKANLQTSGIPVEGTTRFDRLSVHVPLLLREAKILQKVNRTIPESRTEELKKLTTAREVVEFRELLDAYGPYTTQCCVS